MSTPSAVMTPGGLSSPSRAKFLIGFGVIIAAIVYLIASKTLSNAQYFLTVQELQDKGASVVGRSVRLSGAVIGESITYDAETLTLSFTIANVTNDLKEIETRGGLAQVLYEAVSDPTAPRLSVIYIGPKPDLMKPEAQAIVEGRLGEDGIFRATDLLLKCPTRYEEQVPAQSN
jgi:cytochrome c-type biogenesis protein CcmE